MTFDHLVEYFIPTLTAKELLLGVSPLTMCLVAPTSPPPHLLTLKKVARDFRIEVGRVRWRVTVSNRPRLTITKIMAVVQR